MDKKIISCPGCNGRGYIPEPTAKGQYATACERCGGYGFLRVEWTNADRIRAMSDEELAAIMIQMTDLELQIPFCKNLPACQEMLENPDKDIPVPKCVDCLLDWLRQPVEEARFPSGLFLDKQESGLTEED